MLSASFAADKEQYIKDTQDLFTKTILPYKKKQKETEAWLRNKRNPKGEAWAMWNAIKAAESLDNSIVKNQQGLDYITDQLAAIANGVQRQPTADIGYVYGSRHGLNLDRNIAGNMWDIALPAAIHTGLNDNSYAAFWLGAGFSGRGDGFKTVNGIDAFNPKITKHRLIFLTWLAFAALLEQQSNNDKFKNPYDAHAKPKRRIIDRIDIDSAWNRSLEILPSKIAAKNSFSGTTKDGKLTNSIAEYINSYKDLFLEHFIPIANLVNDRKHGIIRELEDPEEKERIAREEHEQEERIRNAGKIPEIKDDDIIVGDKLKEEDIALTLEGSDSVLFSNPGGGQVYVNALEYNDTASFILPVCVLDSLSDPVTSVDKLKKISYVVVKLPKSADKQKFLEAVGLAQKQKKDLSNPQIMLVTSKTPEIDGIFAFTPPKTWNNNQRTQLVMIAKPFKGINGSIAKTNSKGVQTFAKSLSKLSVEPREEEKPKKPEFKLDLTHIKNNLISKAKVLEINDLPSGVSYNKFKTNPENTHWVSKDGHITVEVSTFTTKSIGKNFKVEQTRKAIIHDGDETLKIIGDITAKSLHNDGFITEYDGAMIYVQKRKEGEKENTLFALNDAAQSKEGPDWMAVVAHLKTK